MSRQMPSAMPGAALAAQALTGRRLTDTTGGGVLRTPALTRPRDAPIGRTLAGRI